LTNLVILDEFKTFNFEKVLSVFLIYTYDPYNLTKYCSYNKFYKNEYFFGKIKYHQTCTPILFLQPYQKGDSKDMKLFWVGEGNSKTGIKNVMNYFARSEKYLIPLRK
jgi:hypothetical protein